MKPSRIALAALTVSLLLLGTSLSRSRADNVHFVSFDVAVTDKNNNPIVGLDKRHFKVFENDVEQSITDFEASAGPLAVVILMEFSDMIVYYDDNVITPAAGFIRSLHPKDWIGLVTFDVRPEIAKDFTRDKKALFGRLQGLQMPFSREASLYDAVYFALERMEEIEEKGAIFLLSSGMDTVSRHGYRETLKKAEASDTIIYSVGMGQFAKNIPEPYTEPEARSSVFQADSVMRSLAEATGGLSFFPRFSGEYPHIYETVNGDLRHRYTLGFISTNPKADGKWRRLRVEVVDTDVDNNGKPDKVKVRHKKGHYGPHQLRSK